VARSSLRATSASRTPSGNSPPRWYKPRNPAWPCRVCLATERARSPAPRRRRSGIAVRRVLGRTHLINTPPATKGRTFRNHRLSKKARKRHLQCLQSRCDLPPYHL
jgi:hypothetical protein